MKAKKMRRGEAALRRLPATLMPLVAIKTRATAEGGGKKRHFYRPLPTRFRRDGFKYRQIAREDDTALYTQSWSGCSNPSVCYEVIRIRRREGFHESIRQREMQIGA